MLEMITIKSIVSILGGAGIGALFFKSSKAFFTPYHPEDFFEDFDDEEDEKKAK